MTNPDSVAVLREIVAALNVKPIGQFYPGHTAAESEQANEAYYGAERREQVFAAIARLREIERRCWRLLDDAGDDGDSVSFSRNSPDYRRLHELLPTECPGCRCGGHPAPPGSDAVTEVGGTPLVSQLMGAIGPLESWSRGYVMADGFDPKAEVRALTRLISDAALDAALASRTGKGEA